MVGNQNGTPAGLTAPLSRPLIGVGTLIPSLTLVSFGPDQITLTGASLRFGSARATEWGVLDRLRNARLWEIWNGRGNSLTVGPRLEPYYRPDPGRQESRDNTLRTFCLSYFVRSGGLGPRLIRGRDGLQYFVPSRGRPDGLAALWSRGERSPGVKAGVWGFLD